MDILNDGLETSYFEALVQNLLQTPLYQTQGIHPLSLGKGMTKFTIIKGKPIYNSSGIIHGGVQMACADTAMGTSIRAAGYKTSTIRQNSCFLRPCPADAEILCIGKVIKSGSNLFFCEAELFANDTLVSSFDAVFANLGPETIHPPINPFLK